MKKGNKTESRNIPNDRELEETEHMMYTVMNRPFRPEMMMNRMMRDMCMPPHRRPMGFPVDVRKAEDAYILTAELPGVKLEDIAITVENDVLTITADYGHVNRGEREEYLIRERGLRPVAKERSFVIEGIDQSAITAACADGLLTVTLPREVPAEGKGKRRIAITGAANVPAIEAPQA